MTLDIAESTLARQAHVAKGLHEFVVTDLQIDTGDVLMRVHADGTITVQLNGSIRLGAEPAVKTLSLLRAHCAFLSAYENQHQQRPPILKQLARRAEELREES